MNRKHLFKKLNELCLDLEDKYSINCGGCCYVAACIAEQLEIYNIPFTIIHYDECSCHYAIKVSDRYINRSDYKKKEITEELEESSWYLFDEYYANIGYWNNTYNKKYNSTVKRKIKSTFKKCENSRT